MKDTRHGFDSGNSERRVGFPSAMLILAVLAMTIALPMCSPSAQRGTVRTLAERSSIVVRGTVLRVNASDEPLQAASTSTLVITVSRTYAGSEIAGDQTGRSVTVVLSRPLELKVGTEALFFGNPRYVGKSLTMVDEGEITTSGLAAAEAELELGLQARRDVPVRQRLAAASKVFRGKVERESPLPAAGDPKDRHDLGTEHDPEWHVAAVRVISALRGAEENDLVHIIFPASRDITWFNSPKLQPEQEAIFIAHEPTDGELALMRATGVMAFLEKQPADLVTHPLDVLPASDDARVRGLIAREPK